MISAGEVLRGELLERALGPHRHRTEELLDRAHVERRVAGPPARQPVELPTVEREAVLVGGKRESLIARPLRRLGWQQSDLELSRRGIHRRAREGLVLRDRANLARGAKEDRDVEPERVGSRRASNTTLPLVRKVAASSNPIPSNTARSSVEAAFRRGPRFTPRRNAA